MPIPPGFVEVFEAGRGREPQSLADHYALTILQQSYGRDGARQKFLALLTGRETRVPVENAVMEFRGTLVVI